MIVVLAGPGGAGKGTVAAKLVDADDRLWLSRSWTTRPRRPGEAEDAYVFVDRDRFAAAVHEGRFLEHAEFLGEHYGTPIPNPPAGRDVLLEIDRQGAEQVRALDPSALLVLLVPPSEAVQRERLRGRGDDEAAVERRVAKGAEEVAALRQICDYEVVNDDVDRAVAEILAIVQGRRQRVGAGSVEPSEQRRPSDRG